MKRYPMFDPPEYVEWKPAPDVMDEFHAAIQKDPARSKIIADLSEAQLLELYEGMLRFRLHDITLSRWVRQGVISKAWLGTGEEAVTVGNVHALDRKTDIVGPMIRNAGACHEMGIPVADMLREYLATEDSPSKGKCLHVGGLDHGVVAPASQVAALAPVFAGVSLTFKQRGERRVALTWVGDGATKTTASHEGVNFAAVLRLPVIYVFQNNQIALGTRLDQHQAGPFNSWGKAYGMPSFICNGNNVLDTFAATRMAADACREGKGPVLIIADTFRMGGHATHDEREARAIFAPELFEYWGKRDPIGMYESYLEGRGISRKRLEEVEARVIEELANGEKEAVRSRETRMPKPEAALEDVYA
jgi:Pyruvate/2-oxoglutarate dehydrogenase complex, dehydrogenase (E1) component, eukaryotic type, alpha subunit